MQNTLKPPYELQKAGKPFRLMMYEKSRHGVTDPDLVKHMRQMFDFTLEMLGGTRSEPTTTATRGDLEISQHGRDGAAEREEQRPRDGQG